MSFTQSPLPAADSIEGFTRDELKEMLVGMRKASDSFYAAAVQIGNHPFIEFCGLMNEYIGGCREALQKGIAFPNCNTHSGTNLPLHEYQLDYINEKLECIFTGRSVFPSSAKVAAKPLKWETRIGRDSEEMTATDGGRLFGIIAADWGARLVSIQVWSVKDKSSSKPLLSFNVPRPPKSFETVAALVEHLAQSIKGVSDQDLTRNDYGKAIRLTALEGTPGDLEWIVKTSPLGRTTHQAEKEGGLYIVATVDRTTKALFFPPQKSNPVLVGEWKEIALTDVMVACEKHAQEVAEDLVVLRMAREIENEAFASG